MFQSMTISSKVETLQREIDSLKESINEIRDFCHTVINDNSQIQREKFNIVENKKNSQIEELENTCNRRFEELENTCNSQIEELENTYKNQIEELKIVNNNRINKLESQIEKCVSTQKLYSQNKIIEDINKIIEETTMSNGSNEMATTKAIETMIEKLKNENKQLSIQMNENTSRIETNETNIFIHEIVIKDILKNIQIQDANKSLIKELIEEKMKQENLMVMYKEQELHQEKEKLDNKSSNLIEITNEVENTQKTYNSTEKQPEVPLVESEVQQLEEWTNRKEEIYYLIQIDTSVFDQRIKIDTSIFGERIMMNKAHIIIIIEDTEGNKFGGYINSKIDNSIHGYINDSKSFVKVI
ncbi:hypothetical protein ENU1_144620 [Entamoeba nuttalli P19]|uniref:TLDc domain-containing protein n=1 Tax=Entamoeba nuttalli (strain P19) TaxID=1076696 RepID=K2GYS9_ENTNP|nr:hypothetical protein ENU1_144620 [Entamoeba nuttalli P19]EKE39002.1 hypothetical protein ENU1_144620 [Entamoeba nuttalli P19]|eukprot:XP_008858658.1 hypothetical protein ENU1_144620 [Entamoeba nuttalli P19]